ncbi:hypothetical protein GCM10007320_43410 [Pseudorhodoferax aquiterrae]|uniref:Lipoprotein n=1 Tax=Pseudorhodoferax aquiterrae TaxID=747304 RepID=A0ABQ3G8E4_9BURK|nr:hypothetical protein [Pseudorhodoferax aquiterrae]GHC92891.1 hypothetical protein GCM10007320_43410 [Pseudorhodoferax aquiterrae]
MVKIGRRTVVAALLPAVTTLSGCATSKDASEEDDPFCYRSKLEPYIKGPCLAGPVPSQAMDSAAKRFEADPGFLTVFVVRQGWADGAVVVRVRAASHPAVETLPDTLVRLRLRPGAHVLALEFRDQTDEIGVRGEAGQVRFVRLLSFGLSWRGRYRWTDEGAESLRRRAAKTRLVADVVLG